MTRLGFVGLGMMGAPIARRLLAAGHELLVHDRAADAVGRLVEAGAVAARSPADAASGAAAVFLSLPGPPEVTVVVEGDGGVLQADPRPALIVDLSTNAPSAVLALSERCRDAGVAFVDAPVSGGAARAVTGELSVMVGASPDDHDAAAPLLGCFASEVFHVGPTGAGTVAKLANNQLFLGAALVVQEAYLLAASAGLEPNDLHPILKASSASAYASLAPLLLGRRFDDVIFRLDIAAKDLQLAVDAAHAVGVDVPVSAAAADVYRAAVVSGDGDVAFHATLRELERRAHRELPPLERRPRP